RRGLSPDLARDVAVQLTAHDALASHARDELGLDLESLARPVQAAVTSAVSFALRAPVPVICVGLAGQTLRIRTCSAVTLLGVGLLGALGARLGRAPRGRGAWRVLVGGALAMAVSFGLGHLVGAAL